MDGRKNNGGNSTKSKSGIDKRKNEYRNLLDKALSNDDIEKVIKAMQKKAVKDEDVQAAKLILEYYLGKPTQTIEQNSNVNLLDVSIKDLFKFE